jgi:hypothetical protein
VIPVLSCCPPDVDQVKTQPTIGVPSLGNEKSAIHGLRRKEKGMIKRILFAVLVLSLNFGSAFAQQTCESKAVSRLGKPLVGAAKASFLKKCKRDTCQSQAVDRNGRRLADAAKKGFMQKCEREA